jgi:hypothetical protein
MCAAHARFLQPPFLRKRRGEAKFRWSSGLAVWEAKQQFLQLESRIPNPESRAPTYRPKIMCSLLNNLVVI